MDVFAAVLLLVASFALAKPSPGWSLSYSAGTQRDLRTGVKMGGSSIGHIIGHEGKLYAGAGYWMDSDNILYGGSTLEEGWAQLLRLDQPNGNWSVDLSLGPNYLRVEELKSVVFETDGTGKLLKAGPVRLLIAATYNWWWDKKGDEIVVFVRKPGAAAGDNAWVNTTIYTETPGPVDKEDLSVRSACIHRDTVTGVDLIFLSVGKRGLWKGVYDPSSEGLIVWSKNSESGPVPTRPLSIIEASLPGNPQKSLFFSAGGLVYMRHDGPHPSYSLIHNASDLFPPSVDQSDGGIRGLSSIGPAPGKTTKAGDSLLFAIPQGVYPKGHAGCLYRLDPPVTPSGNWTRVLEICVETLVSAHLGTPSYYALCAYNSMYGIMDPYTNQQLHLIGFETVIGANISSPIPVWGGTNKSAFYRGGLFTLRAPNGTYWINEINGPSSYYKRPLVSVVTPEISPFPGEKAVYFGGHDGDPTEGINSDDMAWIFKGDLAEVLRSPPPYSSATISISNSKSREYNKISSITWTDQVTGIMWQSIAEKKLRPSHTAASDYCNNLELKGHTDWRLPNITELRTLIRNCDATHTGGTCNVDAGKCTDWWTCRDSSCSGCPAYMASVAASGCYWPVVFNRQPCGVYWSSTQSKDEKQPKVYPNYMWAVNFGNGRVLSARTSFARGLTRCVRG